MSRSTQGTPADRRSALARAISTCRPGERLPPEAELGTQAGMTPSEVERELGRLARSGAVIRGFGLGWFARPSDGDRREADAYAHELEGRIRTGALPPGYRIEPTGLVSTSGRRPVIVALALDWLVNQGLVAAYQNGVYYVPDVLPGRTVAERPPGVTTWDGGGYIFTPADGRPVYVAVRGEEVLAAWDPERSAAVVAVDRRSFGEAYAGRYGTVVRLAGVLERGQALGVRGRIDRRELPLDPNVEVHLLGPAGAAGAWRVLLRAGERDFELLVTALPHDVEVTPRGKGPLRVASRFPRNASRVVITDRVYHGELAIIRHVLGLLPVRLFDAWPGEPPQAPPQAGEE